MKRQGKKGKNTKESDSSSVPKSPKMNKHSETSTRSLSQEKKQKKQDNYQQAPSNFQPKNLVDKLTMGISKAIKQKVIPPVIDGLRKELQRRSIWNQSTREQGLQRLTKMTHDIINYEQDKLDNFQNTNFFDQRMKNKRKDNDQLQIDIIKTAIQIGQIVRKHKAKTQALKRIQQRLNQGKIKVKPNKNIEHLKTQFVMLNDFLIKSQSRCDLIEQNLNQSLIQARSKQL